MEEFKVGTRELLLGLGAVFLVVGIGFNLRGRLGQGEELQISEEKEGESVFSEVYVEIAGGIMKAGVYKMDPEARINDLLVESGGLSAEADGEWVEKNLNKARKLKDGEKIYIPRGGEQETKGTSTYNTGSTLGDGTRVVDNIENGQVNLNQASKEELETLTGIGPSLAGRILEYREKNGEFKDINELKLVSGIGEKVFEKIKDRIGI